MSIPVMEAHSGAFRSIPVRSGPFLLSYAPLFARVSYQFTPVVFYIKWHAQVYPLFSIKKPIFVKSKQAIFGTDVIYLIL